MSRSYILHRGALPGAAAGAVGGLALGAAMHQMGMLLTVASLVRSASVEAGFAVIVFIAVILGAGFGMLVCRQRLETGEMLFWGLTYGALWWFLGPLTLAPLLQQGRAAWTIGSAQGSFSSLLGLLWYGAVTALAYAAIGPRVSRERARVTAGTFVGGMLAGLVGAWLLGGLVGAQTRWLGDARLGHLSPHPMGPLLPEIGILAGGAFALLYPRLRDGTGPTLIRGTAFGFFCWIVGALTVLPEIEGMGLAWSLDAARGRFPLLPAFLLFGAVVAVLYRWLTAAAALLFLDNIEARDEEGVGTRGLRAVGRGALGGLIGGLVFTIIMVRIGVLPIIGQIVGASSPWSGFIVHLVIANIIGATFGLLFLGRSVDIGSAVGWGVSYGFFWWILGPLTLLPILLGTAPRWTADVAGALIPSLVGHLAYGAALGVTFYLLEARHNPWWISHSEADSIRVERRREQVLTSAPALWALVIVVALTLPVVLTCGMPPAPSGYSMSSRGTGYGRDGPDTRLQLPGGSSTAYGSAGGTTSCGQGAPGSGAPHQP
jgi:uncharacterized membrane protein